MGAVERPRGAVHGDPGSSLQEGRGSRSQGRRVTGRHAAELTRTSLPVPEAAHFRMPKDPEAGGPPTLRPLSQASPEGGGERQLGARPVFLTLLLSRFSLRRLPLCLLLSLPGFLVVEKLQSVRS